MLFAHDTTAALVLAADLVNVDLTDADALGVFLDKHDIRPHAPAGEADLIAVQALRPRFRQVWDADDASRPALINDLLHDSGARPYLFDHDGWGWHLHFVSADTPISDRLAAQAAFAFADLVRLREAGRLRRCEAPDCQAVFTDLSKNQSRRYCDTGNCGNRQHVAAYRARRAATTRTGSGPGSTRSPG